MADKVDYIIDDIYKSIKNHKFKNEYKYINKYIKDLSISDILVEKIEANIKYGKLNGNSTAIGVNKSSLNPDFKVKLDLDFESPVIVASISGDKIVASNFAYINGLIKEKINFNYPYYAGNQDTGFIEVSNKLYSQYFEKINLTLDSIKINNGKFIPTSDAISHHIYSVKIPKNTVLKEYEQIAYIIYSDKELLKQEIVFIDYKGDITINE